MCYISFCVLAEVPRLEIPRHTCTNARKIRDVHVTYVFCMHFVHIENFTLFSAYTSYHLTTRRYYDLLFSGCFPVLPSLHIQNIYVQEEMHLTKLQFGQKLMYTIGLDKPNLNFTIIGQSVYQSPPPPPPCQTIL